MQAIHIIILAVIAFLIVLCVIYFQEIKKYLKSKFTKKKPVKKEKPKEDNKPKYTVEDFKPIAKSEYDDSRDSSLDGLFSDDEFMLDNEFSDMLLEDNSTSKNTIESQNIDNTKPEFSFDKEFAEFNEMFGSKMRKSDKKTISEKIKDLPPELKALLLDNVLKRKDDI